MSILTVLSSLMAIVLSLAFVIGLAWGGLWLLRKVQDGAFGKLTGEHTGRELRFERALPIGQRERLVLVEVDGEQLLLGVTANAITLLRSWPTDEKPHDTHGADGPSAGSLEEETKRKAKRFRLRMAGEDS
jgi:flagellar protein FliO/FliZ